MGFPEWVLPARFAAQALHLGITFLMLTCAQEADTVQVGITTDIPEEALKQWNYGNHA
jgi:hypothetical protein